MIDTQDTIVNEEQAHLNVVRFYMGEETRLVIDSFNEINQSLFKDCYNGVLQEIDQYVLHTYSSIKDVNEEKIKRRLSFAQQTADVYESNIFAFVGDRGAGKTSCMLSVANMLDSFLNWKETQNSFKGLRKCQKGFEILETIDPSFFDKNRNILDIMLGRMFSKFNNAVRTGSQQAQIDNYEEKKHKLYKQFQRVKDCLSHIDEEGTICSEDTVNSLLHLTATVDMRSEITTLINNYLIFFEKDYLVLPIDDIDLHTHCAYSMVEEIRKYLRQPQIIVLMALKIDQLEQVIKREYTNLYEKVLSKNNDKDGIQKQAINDMAIKYIVKLIPECNRFYLPTLSIWVDTAIEVYERDYQSEEIYHGGAYWKKTAPFNDEYTSLTVKYYVTALIYKKTRFLFYHTKGLVSPIVPTNLRELRHLIATLNEMPSFTLDFQQQKETDYETKQKNKEQFIEYFIGYWATNNLNYEDRSFLRSIFEISETSIINKTIIQRLSKSYVKIDEEYIKNEINKVFNINNSSYNISIGDVLAVINLMKKQSLQKNEQMFFFALETFYSMKLFEFYDKKTEKQQKKQRKHLDENIDYSIIKRDIFKGIFDYEILVAGNIVNSVIYQFCAQKGTGNSALRRDIRKINNYFLREKFEQAYQNNDVESLKVIEFIILCLSRKNYDTGKKGSSEEKYREQNEIVSNEEFQQKFAIFDVMSLFANLTRIERQYNRFDSRLLTYATQKGVDSLYNELKVYCQNNRHSEEPLLSWVSIRNTEVLNDFIDSIEYHGEDGDNEIIHIIKLLRRIYAYNIKTYDKNGKEPNEIDFKFISIFIDLFAFTNGKKINNIIIDSSTQNSPIEKFSETNEKSESNETDNNNFESIKTDKDIINQNKTLFEEIFKSAENEPQNNTASLSTDTDDSFKSFVELKLKNKKTITKEDLKNALDISQLTTDQKAEIDSYLDNAYQNHSTKKVSSQTFHNLLQKINKVLKQK